MKMKRKNKFKTILCRLIMQFKFRKKVVVIRSFIRIIHSTKKKTRLREFHIHDNNNID